MELESLRSFQYNRLLLNKDLIELFSNEFNFLSKYKEICSYNDYLFSLYVFKMQSIVKNILFTNNFILLSFCFSLDLFFQDLLVEYEKRILFIYNSFYFELKDNTLLNQNLFFPQLSIYNVNLYQKDFFLLINKGKEILKSGFCFEILISLSYCINKFKDLNFFHNVKNRPIGNIKYIFLDDNKIIYKFSNIFVSEALISFKFIIIIKILLTMMFK